MDMTQALKILTALAKGTHPNTGEVFPPDSPYQSPDVIRALYTAVRALERSTSRPTTKPSSHDDTPTNAGQPWSAEEDKQLLAAFDAGKSLVDLAAAHGRTVSGIRARLEKHGRLEPSSATRWPMKSSPSSANGPGAR